MIAVLDVSLVDRESEFLHVFLAILGPALIAGAAVVAALVARATANKRQEEQLAHDTQRQAEQLRRDSERQEELLLHDREQQKKQLRHDRAMRDRDFLRRTVSSTLESALSAIDAVSTLSVETVSLEELNAEALAAEEKAEATEKGTPAHEKALEVHLEALRSATKAMKGWSGFAEPAHRRTIEMLADNVRLRALVGVDNPVKATHWKLAEIIRNWHDSIPSDELIRSDTEHEATKLAHEKVGPALEEFENACRNRFPGGRLVGQNAAFGVPQVPDTNRRLY